jgi:hypothetical protein
MQIKIFTPKFDKHGSTIQIEFPSGWGVSITKNSGSYGHEDGLWELAVLKDGELNYENPITDDVLGYLTDEKVAEYIEQVKSWS